ncbi:GM26659 [Drosophila sechellia]|uniref:Odorant receptor n=1 Tax=Drosophila sechellia TaxID=7238 RepID=B4IE30_DROSE|nr:GM26659 [Drosophila sechellia]
MFIIDSLSFYRPFWICMRLLVPTFFKDSSRPVQLYVVLLHILVTLWFPLHLLLHLLLLPSTADFFKNLTMSLTCVACSLKHVAHLYHLPQIVEIESLIKHFGMIYAVFLFGVLVQVISGKWELLYPAYFPFDLESNRLLGAVALGYQVFSMLVEGFQALGNDTYTPLTLCLLAGHIHLWSIRMGQLGYFEEEAATIHQRLLEYIEQHKLLVRFHNLVSRTISEVQLVQLGGCGATLCIIVSYMLFFVGDTISLVYYLVFFGVVCVQLFPSCYFASEVAEEVERLPYAIFSSRWYDQSRDHRFDLLIFTQLTLGNRGWVIKAGGLIELNLNAFFATLKMAYSLFAVVVRAKVDDEPFARNANEEKPLALHAGKVRWTTDCISVQESGAGQTLAHTCPRTRGKKEWDVAKDTQRTLPRQFIDANATMSVRTNCLNVCDVNGTQSFKS